MREDQYPPHRLVAVVVTYNRLSKLKITLERLLDTSPDELEMIVVVDNASTDGTTEWLSTLTEDRVDVVSSTTNEGGAGGFEKGLRHAQEQYRPDWFVVMDDDARPDHGAITQFQKRTTDHWDAIAAAVYMPSGEICEMNRPSLNPFGKLEIFWKTCIKGRDGFHIPHSAYESSERLINVASFVGLFLSKKCIEISGYPDGALFIYGDDALYTLDLSSGGARIGFAPDIRFEHDFTTLTAQSDGQRFRPLWKVYYHHRNLLLLYRRAAGLLFWLILPIVLAKWLFKVRHHKGAQRSYLKFTLLAIWDGLRRNLSRAHIEILSVDS